MSTDTLCFVISPIGLKDRVARVHADAIKKNLVEPALAVVSERLKRRVVAPRSDHDVAAGDILKSVIRRIVGGDVVIAILFGNNPNVYYELGIAHSAGRPVVMLCDEEERPHFDTRQQRVIEFNANMVYDAKPASERPVVRELADAICHALDAPRAQKAFDEYDALGGQFVDFAVLPAFHDLELPSYGRFFADAQRFIGLMGTSLHFFTLNMFKVPRVDGGWVSFPAFVQAAVVEGGYDVTLVLMDEDNPALPQMLTVGQDADVDRAEIARVRMEIGEATLRWQSHAKNIARLADPQRSGSLRLVKVKSGTIHHRLSTTDRGAIVSPYFFSVDTNSGGPAIRAAAGTAYYEALRRDFDYLVRTNSPTLPKGAPVTSSPPSDRSIADRGR